LLNWFGSKSKQTMPKSKQRRLKPLKRECGCLEWPFTRKIA
jgi:hypothetical protein